MSQIAHDLFLFMISLSQLKSAPKAFELYLDAVNEWLQGPVVQLVEKDAVAEGVLIEIATSKKQYALMEIQGNVGKLDEATMALVRNSAKILALILEKLEQDDLLKDETVYLERMVAERTEELSAANKRLQKEIEEKAAAEQALRESENRWLKIIDQMPVMLVAYGKNGRIVYWNQECERVSGYRSEEVLKSDDALALLFPNRPDRDLIRKSVEKNYTDFRNAEFPLKARNGEIKIIAWHNISHSTPIPPWQSWIVGIDITDARRSEIERTRLEDQLVQSQKLESIGRLAGGVAHDFNNILTGISGYVEILLDPDERVDSLEDDLREIQTATERAKELVNQLLAFGRRQIIMPKLLDSVTVFRDLGKMLRRVLGDDIIIKIEIDENSPKIHADLTQLSQVCVNIALNSREAMPGGGTLELKCYGVDLPESICKSCSQTYSGPHLRIEIADTGRGMTPHTLEHMFEPFYTAKKFGTSSGLGLSTVFGAVRQNNGHIFAESELGKGTRIMIDLPSAENQSNLNNGFGQSKLPRGSETVLLAEDEVVVRRLARKILQRQGYNVLEASDGLQALEILKEKENDISLLLTDVVMPHLSGTQLFQEAVKLRPNLKVIYMSGYTEEVTRQYGIIDQGANFIAKPFAVENLILMIRKAIDF